ncbi:uncharacterized protein LOC102064609 isoform X4 [Zonotrichia albicollis]|uniref:uncharacterized protein LOC102064609 isoform X4 n=1 Tax=Zonotrichia albicollis TaxID=44394 RepID=UPI003D80BA38
MEALRAAGRAVLRSPRLARHGLGLRRRRKLPESWADMQEPLLEGMCFTLKYLGMTLVEKPKGEDMAAAAIRRIVATDLLLHNRQAAEQSLCLCCPEPGERGTGVPCLPLTQEEDCPGCDSDCGPGLSDGTGSLGSSTCRRRKRRRKMIMSVKPCLVPAAAVPFLPCQGREHAVSLRRPCLGYDGCCVLFQSSMEELGKGLHSPAGLIPLVPPSSSPQAQLLCCRLGPPPHSWTGLGGAGGSPSTGTRTAGPSAPLG